MERPHASAEPLPHPPAARLALSPALTAALGYDVVGTPREHGERIMKCLSRVGCVFADDLQWWWIVPAGCDIGVTWPPSTSCAVDARLGRGAPEPQPHRADPSWSGPRADRPLLIHRPDGDSPYTPSIPLYFLACRLAGSTPHWSSGPVPEALPALRHPGRSLSG